jgi:Tol biopolymer transport system component
MMITKKINKIFIILFLSIHIINIYSQGFYFGRNKIQYTQFNWHILKTEHFDIYYYPEMLDIAEKGAKFAEDTYFYLQTKFNHTIEHKIPLIFYSSQLHFQQTNVTPGFIPEGVGGFFEFIKGRVVIPSNGDINQFRRVINHELIHVFMYSKLITMYKNRSMLNGLFPPLWFTEGLAEFWSTEWDSQCEMVIKDAVLFNYIVAVKDIWSIEGSFMMYKEGQYILKYIAEHYGEDKILLLLENLWKHHNFENCFNEVTGKNYREFDEEWLYYLKKNYYPQLADDDFSSKVSETIVREGYNFKPAFYQDKGEKKVVYIANKTGYTSIYMSPLNSLHPDQKNHTQMLIKGEKSTDFETFHLFNSKIDVNKDGILTFVSKSGENDALYLYDIQKRKISGKYYFADLVGILSPSWSPDAQKIVFSGLNFSGYKDLYILNPATEELIKLTNDFYDDNDPCWSPDGKYIIFSSNRTNTGNQRSSNIFIINVNSGDISYLTYGKHKDLTPVFSPDGKYIAYTSDRDLTINIYLTELNEKYDPVASYKLTNFANAAFDPEWTPDQGILFSVYENRKFQIRYLAEIQNLMKNSDPIQKTVMIKPTLPWTIENLKKDKQVESIKYDKKYDLDIVQSQVSFDPIFGTAGGAQVAFTDILGNDQYHILIFNNARASSEFFRSFNFALSKISLAKRMNYAYGIYRFAGLYFNYDDAYYYEDRIGGFLSLRYPLSQFIRLEFSSHYFYSDKDWFWDKRRYAYLSSNFISFVKDNSIWSSSGPIEGQRINITLGNTFDTKYSNVNYYTLLADYRQYFRLSLRSAYAIRILYFRNQGEEARRFYFGGSWDLRGYRRWSILTRKMLLTSQELRFPFIDFLGIKFPVISMGFNSIRGALFFDAAKIWTSSGYLDGDDKSEFKGSYGFGIRLRLIGFLVLRWDFGKTTDFKHISKKMFTQFFFGWDF